MLKSVCTWAYGDCVEPRVKRLYEKMEELEEEADVVVIVNGTDPMLDMTFYYATRLNAGVFEGSVAVLHPDGELDVITSLLEEESASKGDFNLHVFKTGEEMKEMLGGLLKGSGKVGINGNEITFRNYSMIKDLAPSAQIMDVSKSVTRTRIVKDDDEINLLRKACKISSEVAGMMTGFIKEGMVEYEVAAEMCYRMQKKGAVGPAFDTIVAFGKNSAEPHYHAGEVALKRGEFILLDFGALYNRYRSDITRTYFCGQPSEKQREMYEVVAEAQRRSLEAITVGVPASEPHAVAADYINSTKFEGLFTHGLGHGLGLATHDGGGLIPRAEDIIMEEGMVFTVEPGVYEPGFGGVRIEDDVVVRKEGVEILTDASRDVFVV